MAASTIHFFKLFLLSRLTQSAFKRVNEIVGLSRLTHSVFRRVNEVVGLLTF